MSVMKRTVRPGPEQLIDSLVLGPLPREAPTAAPLPALPSRRPPADPQALPVLDMARLDRSGRLSARAMLKLLGWGPGHRVDVNVVGGALHIAVDVDGAHLVGSRGDLVLPAAARTMCGITVAEPVVLAAYPTHGVVVVHPVSTAARLIHKLHIGSVADDAR
jgi:hypothetical protein